MATASKKKEKVTATGMPKSPTEDLTDHSQPASAIAAQVDLKGEGGATASAKSMDALNAKAEDQEAEARAEEDNSITGKIRRSELHYVTNNARGQKYVGISPQNDPDASAIEKRLSAVESLDGVAPQTGMIIEPKDGAPFTVPDGYGPEKTPADWASIIDPNTKKPLFG